jgi:hypothetical protein
MEVSINRGSESLEVEVRGGIDSFQEISELKNRLHTHARIHPEIPMEIYFLDAYVIPSSVIGTILELIEIEKIEVRVKVAKEELYETLQKLMLQEILHLQKSTPSRSFT